MLMSLGFFVFQLNTLPFSILDRQSSYKWASNDRFGKTPSNQFIGRDSEIITLSGRLMPEISGGTLSLHLLRKMAENGEAYLLLGGTGELFGNYIITEINESRSELLKNGQPQKIDFDITLKRYDDKGSLIADLSPFISAITKPL